MQQRGCLCDRALLEGHAVELTAFVEQRQRQSREVVGPERMLEPRVSGAGIHQVREAELPNVSEPLKYRRVDELQSQRVDTDVVPQRIPDNHTTRSWLLGGRACCLVWPRATS